MCPLLHQLLQELRVAALVDDMPVLPSSLAIEKEREETQRPGRDAADRIRLIETRAGAERLGPRRRDPLIPLCLLQPVGDLEKRQLALERLAARGLGDALALDEMLVGFRQITAIRLHGGEGVQGGNQRPVASSHLRRLDGPLEDGHRFVLPAEGPESFRSRQQQLTLATSVGVLAGHLEAPVDVLHRAARVAQIQRRAADGQQRVEEGVGIVLGVLFLDRRLENLQGFPLTSQLVERVGHLDPADELPVPLPGRPGPLEPFAERFQRALGIVALQVGEPQVEGDDLVERTVLETGELAARLLEALDRLDVETTEGVGQGAGVVRRRLEVGALRFTRRFHGLVSDLERILHPSLADCQQVKRGEDPRPHERVGAFFQMRLRRVALLPRLVEPGQAKQRGAADGLLISAAVAAERLDVQRLEARESPLGRMGAL